MSSVLTEVVRRACSFVIRIDMPLKISKEILEYLLNRNIILQSRQMQGVGDGEAILILHCLMERDRIMRVQQTFEKTNGILSVLLLENKTSPFNSV
jgi:hypothetical protein